MSTLAEQKYAEAFADDIALELRDNALADRVEVVFDHDAQGWAVRVDDDRGFRRRTRHELLMPTTGALFAYFRDGTFVGGMGMRLGDVPPRAVASQFVARMLDL